jgi:predicted amidohydrolase
MLPHPGAGGESVAPARDDENVKALLTALRCPKGELEANARRHLALLEEGATRGARIVAFPEMSLTGSVDPIHWPGRAVSRTHAAIGEIATATERLGVAALFGIAEASGDGVHITQLLADGGRIVGHYRKRTLGEDEESYRAGSESAGFVLDQEPIGIAVCAEGAVDAPFDDAAASGATVVFFCSAPGLYGRRTNEEEWRAGFDWWSGSALGDAARHARRLGVWVALSTQAGSAADEDFPGLAALVDPNGDVVSALPDWREGTLLVETETETETEF